MNGAHLLQTLHELGCSKAGDVSPDSVEWMFTDDAAVPFLEWFCNCIDPATNYISKDDSARYALLITMYFELFYLLINISKILALSVDLTTQ